MRSWLLVAFALVLAACGNKPRQPDWLVDADGSQDRFQRAYLRGDERVANAEFARLMRQLSSTGDPKLIARGELTRCAVQVASLVFDECAGFERLRADAPAEERAYADFLAGRLPADRANLLPEAYRGVATAGAFDARKLESPVSRLVAAGVLVRTGRADPQVMLAASEVASEQGWRRAVLSWLGARAILAEKSGNTEEAQRLRRRMALASEAR